MRKNLLVVLTTIKCRSARASAAWPSIWTGCASTRFYTGLKQEVLKVLNRVPVFGDPAEKFLAQIKEAVKAGLHGGMLFEEMGFRYMGPVDGHNISQLRKYLAMVKDLEGPVLLHVVTEKGHGFKPAAADPVFFHTPVPFTCEDEAVIPLQKSSAARYTDVASQAIYDQMTRNPRVTVMTAAMCQGNKLERVREAFPDRFFDTGICESHAVAFAAGQAKAGLRPIVDIYSTFLQRSFDQIFQEVALQNLPVTMLLDRGGLTGPDGPTHHGMFDLGYMRLFPNIVVMAPGDEWDLTGHARLRPGPRLPRVDSLSQGHRRSGSTATSGRRSNWAGPKCSTGATTACSSPAARCWATA